VTRRSAIWRALPLYLRMGDQDVEDMIEAVAEGFRQDLERLRHLVATRDREGAVEQLWVMATRY